MTKTVRAEFSEKTKREALALRDGRCPGLVELKMPCGKSLEGDCEFDHIMRNEIKPDNSLENCRPLCRTHHKIKTALDAKAAAKGRRMRGETKKSQRKKQRNTIHAEITRERKKDDALNRKLQKDLEKVKKPSRPIVGSKASGWKRKMDGTLVRRDG